MGRQVSPALWMMIRPGDHSKKFSSLPHRMNALAEKCLNSGVSNEKT